MERRHRRANIIATLGPATGTAEMVLELALAGMDVARVNLAHGTHDDHRRLCALAHGAGAELGRPIAVMADIAGPKIRVGHFANGPVTLHAGDRFVITTEPCEGDAQRVSTSYTALARDVQPGNLILIDDGNIKARVLSTDGTEVVTEIVEGGPISDHKGLNLPGVAVSAPALSEEDTAALINALASGVDLVALSFVRHPDDADAVRRVMASAGRCVPVIAKIEKPEVLSALPAIVVAFDGLMVARGDLGVEAPLEWVPLIQKRAINLARASARPVIVATQMLESMITHSRPTRAETSDVANAIFDGADAVMLSAETGVGAHPVEAVAMMDRIITAAENDGGPEYPAVRSDDIGIPDSVAAAAVSLAERLSARALVAYTTSGRAAQLLAARRPQIAIIACTPDEGVSRQLALTWGVESIIVDGAANTDQMVDAIDATIRAHGIARPGDLVVVVAGAPIGADQAINTVMVHQVGGVPS
ncbi:MAG: pyruvate kinase [Acidimicrobiales bacterium]